MKNLIRSCWDFSQGEEEGATPVGLLVCCSEGSMALVTLPPSLLDIDTTHSYHLSSVKVVSRTFVSIKDRLKVRDWELYATLYTVQFVHVLGIVYSTCTCTCTSNNSQFVIGKSHTLRIILSIAADAA